MTEFEEKALALLESIARDVHKLANPHIKIFSTDGLYPHQDRSYENSLSKEELEKLRTQYNEALDKIEAAPVSEEK